MSNKFEALEDILGRPEKGKKDRFVVPLAEYESLSPRVTGMQELNSLGLPIPEPMFILGHTGFETYKKSGMTEELINKVSKAFREIRRINPGRGAYVGRAFFVPGIEAPTGPRTAAIYKEEDYLTEVEKFFQFAQGESYDVPGADIALVFHPFIHAARPPMIEAPLLEWPGGDLIPLPKEGGIFIRTTFGPDEAVQGFPHDEYQITITKEEIRIRKNIGNKTATLIPREANIYERIQIPPEFQTKQVLTDFQILELVNAYLGIHKTLGPRRLEFIVQPKGIIFRECFPFEVKPETLFPLDKGEIVGPVIRITSETDVPRIEEPIAITHLTPEVFQRRDVNLFALLASEAKKRGIDLIVLSHGTIATAHLVRVFTDLGQSVVFVGEEDYFEGEEVRVFKEDGIPRVERLKGEGKLFVDLSNLELMEKIEVGGKARNLAKLGEARFSVPRGFCIPTELFDHQLALLNLKGLVEDLDILEGEPLRQQLAKIRKGILESSLSSSFERALGERLKICKRQFFAVRSSANYEDDLVAFAGLFKTFLKVPKQEVSQRVRQVWASLFSEEAIRYAKSLKIPLSDLRMGVIVQEMLKADKAGVIFTRERDLGLFTISATKGSAEELAAGREERLHQLKIELDKEKIKIKRTIEERANGPVLTSEEINKLLMIGLEIEKIFGGPQDIEWLIRRGRIYILQTRSLPHS